MLREIAATFRLSAAARAAPPLAVAIAIVLGGALLAGCGIKGALKLPPPATTTMPAAAQAPPPATAEPAPAAEAPPPAKP